MNPPIDGYEPSPLDDIDLDGTDAPLNPVEVEAGIRKVSRLVHYGVRTVTDAEREHKKKAREHDRAYARAYLSHDGPVHEKRYVAELHPDVVAAADARDVAELAFRHAERQQKSLIESLWAIRAIGASVKAMYSAETGFGR